MRLKMEILISAFLFGASTTANAMTLTPEQEAYVKTQKEVRRKIAELRNSVGIDTKTNLIRGGYSDAKLNTCLEAVNHPHRTVQATALELVREIVRQLDVPRSTLDKKVKPLMEQLIKMHRDSSTNTSAVLFELARKVRWLIELKRLPTEGERVEFLKRTMELDNSAFEEKLDAIEHLVGIASDDALAVLRSLIEKKKAHKDKTHFDRRVESAIEQVELIHKSSKLPATEFADLLKKRIHSKKSPRYEDIRDGVWCIRHLEKVGDRPSVGVLKGILADTSFDSMIRYEAQEALIRAKALKEENRTVMFGH